MKGPVTLVQDLWLSVRPRKHIATKIESNATAADIEELKRQERQARERVEFEALKAAAERLEAELAALRGRPPLDTLTFLPACQGRDYAQGVTAGEFLRYDLAEAWQSVSTRMEILSRCGERNFYLDMDHDFRTRVFEVWRLYYVPCAGIFCEGQWTKTGARLRSLFKGVSPS